MTDRFLRSTDGSDSDNGTTWALAFATLQNALTNATNKLLAGDRLFIADAHSETVAGSVTFISPGTTAAPCYFYCVDDTGDPASPSTLAATAVIASTGYIDFRGGIHASGLILEPAGSLLSFTSLSTGEQRWEACKFRLTGVSAGNRIQTGSNTTSNGAGYFSNCTMRFAQATQGISHLGGSCIWEGGGIEAGGTALTSELFRIVTANVQSSRVSLSHLDLSELDASCDIFNIGSTQANRGFIGVLRDCKLPASWTGTLVSGTHQGPGPRYAMFNCDDGDTQYQFQVEDWAGTLTPDTGVYLNATLNSVPLSWKIVSNAGTLFHLPFECAAGTQADQEIVIDVTPAMVGVSQTVTIEIVHDSATALTDRDIWATVVHPGTSGFSLGVDVSTRADILATGSAYAASSASWTGTSGFSNENKQKIDVVFTPAEDGFARINVVLAKPSKTVWVDPAVTVSAT